MKTLTVDEIVKRVRTVIDEIAANESEMISTEEDNANVDAVIKESIPAAYRYIATTADVSMLEGKDGTTASLSIDANLVGRVAVPADAIRIINARLSSWDSSFGALLDESSPQYRMQSHKWVCASPRRPVAANVHQKSGRVLELFKAATSSDKLIEFTYIPNIGDSFSSVGLSDSTVEAFIYYVAALTMVTFREDLAEPLFKISRNLLGVE
jgi:hypothetical protein